MSPLPFSRDLYVCLGTGLMLACSAAGTSAQTRVGDQDEANHDIRIVIHTECPYWNRTTETVVSGTVENLTDRALELSVDPALYLSSKTSNEMRDTFWAPVDLLHDRPISTDKKAISADGKVESIESRPILLRFKNKGETINFRIDARHLLWAMAISSVWPSQEFFNTVKSDVYALQLVMETHNGRVESPKVEISIDSSKPMDEPQSSGPQQETETPQSISRAMFQGAPEKARSVACFRTLSPGMSAESFQRSNAASKHSIETRHGVFQTRCWWLIRKHEPTRASG